MHGAPDESRTASPPRPGRNPDLGDQGGDPSDRFRGRPVYDCVVHRTAFVTGGTGFLGRHIVEQLTSMGWHVVALHRPKADVRHLVACRAELCVGSVTDAKSVGRAMPPSCDAVFHVAGNMSLWSGGNAEQTQVNVLGTRIVAQAALDKETKRFIHTSSVSAWGEQRVVPFDETAKQRARRSFVNYERTKFLGELEVERTMGQGLRAVILNPGAIVGRYDSTGWARLIRLVHSGKLQGAPPGALTWAHAEQVARAHIAAVDHARPGERYLLGGADATMLEALTIIGNLTGKKVPERATPQWVLRAHARLSQWGSLFTGRPPNVTPEIVALMARPPHYFRSDKAIAELGYRPVPIADMLRESYEWLKNEKLLEI
jgi:dihydroflavonol-4-reductase